jgi:7-cyano-7-deazaguanine synthase in queuosine biosynthesis
MRTAVAFSGGVDSTACAVRLLEQGINVELLHIDWREPRNPTSAQLEAAHDIANDLGVRIRVVSKIDNSFNGWEGSIEPLLIMAARVGGHPRLVFGSKPNKTNPRDYREAWTQYANAVSNVSISFPVWAEKKKETLSTIPHNLLPLLWFCTRPNGCTSCGECDKCRAYEEYIQGK